ncbi:MAG: cytochrome c3 family protein, partial [Bacteroidales bacterium]|nr:cytochrome c3 family protein [Bacteroidales bacterium]
ELCYKCHDGVQEEMEKKTIHSPAKENCFNCHNPYNSKESYLLLKPSAELCYSCHESSKEQIEKASIVHKALNEEQFCANCHSPHGSDEANYLRSGEKELCLNCHNKIYTNDSVSIDNIKKLLENSKSIHKPVNEGCSSCHNAHVAEYPGLLIKKFPVGLYAESNKEEYALCFSCHKTELLELEKSNTATNFRNGDQNLHFMHIKGKRGRSCITCHNVHASKNEYLIENNVLFGNWKMPIKFVKHENGGSCAPGCHSEEMYDRGE